MLLAVSDSNYKFTYFDIGARGSECDANIFLSSKFGRKVMTEELDFPNDKDIDGNLFPFFFIGDGAFPLSRRMMKPFSSRNSLNDDHHIFNYRLSRARRCVENAFGILSTKWLCLKRTMFCNPDRAQKIISACCLLHNYLISTRSNQYCPQNYVDQYNEKGELIPGEWRGIVEPNSLINATTSHIKGRSSLTAKTMREQLMKYFCTTGAIPWQRKAAGLD